VVVDFGLTQSRWECWIGPDSIAPEQRLVHSDAIDRGAQARELGGALRIGSNVVLLGWIAGEIIKVLLLSGFFAPRA